MKKKYYIPLAVLLLLIITNPSVKSFKEHLGESSYSGLKRETNLFIYSFYSFDGDRYLGVAENFFKISKPDREVIARVDSIRTDSAAMNRPLKISNGTNDTDPVFRNLPPKGTMKLNDTILDSIAKKLLRKYLNKK